MEKLFVLTERLTINKLSKQKTNDGALVFFFYTCVTFWLFHRQQLLVVVESNANNSNNCVVVIVLLLTSKNKSAISTILLEFIFNLLKKLQDKFFLAKYR